MFQVHHIKLNLVCFKIFDTIFQNSKHNRSSMLWFSKPEASEPYNKMGNTTLSKCVIDYLHVTFSTSPEQKNSFLSLVEKPLGKRLLYENKVPRKTKLSSTDNFGHYIN